ncbi:MAG: hypothetical protein HY259_09220, partial [Chloroflexi bacterium]|nr:hypothetical protein [Chloroflexota bacterium]
MKFAAGIDVGSTYTKVVIVGADGAGDDRADRLFIAGRHMNKTGFRLAEISARTFQQALDDAGLKESDVSYVVATGVGRYQVPFRDTQVTDLSAHARGARYFFPKTRTILDVGGQTMKASRL